MSIWCTCLILEVQFSWCRCPMWWCKCNVYPWWYQRTYLLMMQMSPYRDEDAKCLVVQMPSNGHVMMQMLLIGMSWCKCPLSACHEANVHVGMPWCKCPIVGMPWCECPFVGVQWCEYPLGACYDANVLLVMCHDASVPLVHAMMRMSHWCMLWCECPFGDAMNVNASLGMQRMQMPPCRYIMTQNALVQTQFIQKFFLFSK